MIVSLIVAVAENGTIGRDGDLPWRLSDDLKRFKRITTGHAIVMGRRTFESIGRALPGRTTIVLTRDASWTPPDGVIAVPSLEAALARAPGDEVFVIGGASVYEEALPRADRLYLTRVHADVEGDTRFPAVDFSAWRVLREEHRPADAKNDHATTFRVLERPVRPAETLSGSARL